MAKLMQFHLSLNTETDKDVINWLREKQAERLDRIATTKEIKGGAQGEIKRLIRAEIAREKTAKE